MAGPLTLVILVAAGHAHDPGTDAVARATRDALGAETRVEVQETAAAPTDADAVRAETAARPDAVAEVIWNDARQAALHVLVVRTGRWVYRTIGFDASDDPVERGRTLGFAVASMLPEGGLPEAATVASAAPTANARPPTPPAPPVPVPAAAPTPAAAPLTDTEPSGPPKATDSRVFLDVFGVGTVGIGGTAEAIGAAAAARWFALPFLAFRLGGGAMGGTVSAADATTLYALGTAGVALHPLRPRPDRPIGVALLLDYVLERQSMSRVAPGGTSPGSYDRWLSGASAMIEGDVLFAPNLEIVLAAGVTDVFASTYVDVQGAQVATLPAVRGQANLGFRIRF